MNSKRRVKRKVVARLPLGVSQKSFYRHATKIGLCANPLSNKPHSRRQVEPRNDIRDIGPRNDLV